ncbi:MAG: hypothetical protein GYB53_10125 [Rhodobacteraceae bacterium]|nr:hypothetical protein [Paracoccaceae bacterium]MBR9820767.1 hypothetical protein [Paracoccaceae bacterium]
MSRSLGYALTAADSFAWDSFAKVASLRLAPEERAALAYASLHSLSPYHAELTACAALSPIGEPLPSYLGGMQEARSWSEFAALSELKAYALAAYEALPAREQMAFRKHITEVEIAA